jgi:AmmeMemoRadiSam system protein A
MSVAELLTKKEQRELLKIARDTVVGFVTSGKIPAVNTASAGLQGRNGCFVTIKQQGQLRGCIGNFESDNQLYRLVQEMAVAAATQDPRFYPMKPQDLDSFDLEISVLSPLKLISSVDDIKVGTHGIYLIHKSYRGVLLPQVATEYGWDRDTFLKHTCLKAGLPENAWEKGCEIYIFSALVFGEK